MAKRVDSTNGEMREIRLLDYAFVVVKWRKIVFWLVGTSLIVSLVLLFFILPRWYKSTAVIMPPQQKSQFSVSSVLRSVVPLGGLGLGKASDEMYNYMAILQSRTCLEEIVRRFDLKNRYKETRTEDAIKSLLGNVEIQLARDDVVLEVTVYDTDSLVAANMANAFVDVLNTEYLTLMTQEAKSNREFLEGRYRENVKALTEAEDAWKAYQEKTGTLITIDPSSAGISGVVELYATKAKKEIELGVIKRSIGVDNPAYQKAEVELQAIDAKLRNIPDIGIESLRLYRDVAIQQKVMEILFPLVEQAKIEEHRDTPTILVLDRAVPAEKPAKPRRILVTALVMLCTLIVSVFVVFIVDYVKRLNEEIRVEPDEKMSYLASELKWRKFFYLERHPASSKHTGA